MGGGVPRIGIGRWYRQVAAGVRGPRPSQHHMHPGQPRVRVPHNGLQLAGRQDPRRAARPTRHAHWPGERVLRLLEGPHDQRHLGPQLHQPHRRQTVQGVLCKYSPPY